MTKGRRKKIDNAGGWVWQKYVAMFLFMLLLVVFAISEYRVSQVFGRQYRYNMTIESSSGEVAFLSFDPSEKQIFVLPLPQSLEIESRSVGSYRIDKLYSLGSYEGSPGEFVRKKVQGFMRVPVMGYLTIKTEKNTKNGVIAGLLRTIVRGRKQTTLSRLDAIALLGKIGGYSWKEADQDELIRAGVLTREGDKLLFAPERLQQYLGVRVFDWGIGGEGVTVAVINESREGGLASDISRFLTNVGLDVVSVKSGTKDDLEETRVIYKDERGEEISTLLSDWFSWGQGEMGDTDEYRAEIVIYVGRDAEALF